MCSLAVSAAGRRYAGGVGATRLRGSLGSAGFRGAPGVIPAPLCTPQLPGVHSGSQEGRRVPVLFCFAEGRAVVRIGRRDTRVHIQVLKPGIATMVRKTTTGRHTKPRNGVVVVVAVGIIGRDCSTGDGRHVAEVLHRELLVILPCARGFGRRRCGHFRQTRQRVHGVGAVQLRHDVYVGRAAGDLVDERAALPPTQIAEEVLQPEEHRHRGRVERRPVSALDGVVDRAAAVGEGDADIRRQERKVAEGVGVVGCRRAPPRPGAGNTVAEATLPKPVGILVGVHCGLHVPCPEDDAEQDAYRGGVGVPVGLPPLPLLAGVFAKGRSVEACRSAAQQRPERAVLGRVVVAAAVADAGVDDAAQLQVGAVDHGDAKGRRARHRDAVVQPAGDGLEARRLVVVAAFGPPCVVPGGSPAPHVVAHRPVELRRLAGGELVVVRRVELAPAVVAVNEVAPEAEQRRQGAQVVDVADRLSDGAAVVDVPSSAGVALVGHEAQGDEAELLAGLREAEHHVLGTDGLEIAQLVCEIYLFHFFCLLVCTVIFF